MFCKKKLDFIFKKAANLIGQREIYFCRLNIDLFQRNCVRIRSISLRVILLLIHDMTSRDDPES